MAPGEVILSQRGNFWYVSNVFLNVKYKSYDDEESKSDVETKILMTICNKGIYEAPLLWNCQKSLKIDTFSKTGNFQ